MNYSAVEIFNTGWDTIRDNPCSSPEYETKKPGAYAGFSSYVDCTCAERDISTEP